MVSVYNGENSNKIFILTAARVKYLIEESINGEVETDYAGFNDKMFVKIKANAIPETEFNYQVYNLSKKILLGKSDEDIARSVLRSYDRYIHSLIFKKEGIYGNKPVSTPVECPEENA